MGKPRIIIAGAGGIGVAAKLAEVLSETDVEMVDADEPIAHAFEAMPEEDFRIPTAKERYLAGGRPRGTKRTDIPRPKDLYRQHKGRKP